MFIAISPFWIIASVWNEYFWKKGRKGGKKIELAVSFEVKDMNEWVWLPDVSLVSSWEHSKLRLHAVCKSELSVGLEPALCVQKINKTDVRQSKFLSPYSVAYDQIVRPRKNYNILPISVLVNITWSSYSRNCCETQWKHYMRKHIYHKLYCTVKFMWLIILQSSQLVLMKILHTWKK